MRELVFAFVFGFAIALVCAILCARYPRRIESFIFDDGDDDNPERKENKMLMAMMILNAAGIPFEQIVHTDNPTPAAPA